MLDKESMNRDQLLELIPAYALGILEGDEQAAVAKFVETDAEARALLDTYGQITDVMLLDVPARNAPAHLQDDLRERLRIRQAELSTSPKEKIIPMTQPQRTSWLSRLGVAAVLLTVGAAFLLSLIPGPSNSRELIFRQISDMEGSHRVAIEPVLNQEIEGELVYTPIGEQAIIRVSNLPVLGEDQTYQLWLNSADGTRSGGMFRPASDGSYYIDVPVRTLPAFQYTFFGVSIEPKGGSPYTDRPSGERVFTVDPNAGRS
jgi:anti-sigma-K factor RskA